ncbi:hypothetical protein ES708_18354 [subsurface metagenome]
MLSLWCALVGIIKPTRRDGNPPFHPAEGIESSSYLPLSRVSNDTGLKY